MANYAPYHQALAHKLGWSDMLSHVAINAIDTIVFNHMSIAQERHGEEMTPEMSTAWLLGLTPNQVFGFLGDNGDPNYLGSPHELEFIELKPFFEYAAKKAHTCNQAISMAKGYKQALDLYIWEAIELQDILDTFECQELPSWAERYIKKTNTNILALMLEDINRE